MVDGQHLIQAGAVGAMCLAIGSATGNVAAVAMSPTDLGAWVMFVGNLVFSAVNGSILIYHLIGNARREESRAWRAEMLDAVKAAPSMPAPPPGMQPDTRASG